VFQRFRRIDRYAWQGLERNGGEENIAPGFGTITRAQFALSTNLQPKQKKDRQQEEENADVTEEERQFINDNRQDYVDFDIPWSLQLRYNLSYTNDPRRRLIEGENDRIRQSLMFSGDLNLAPKWKVGFSSGFDFQREEITQTSINVFRDLDCFELRFDWVPFGRFTSYYVQVNIKSSMLSDLKLQRRRAWQDF
jgi:hypothetical protein